MFITISEAAVYGVIGSIRAVNAILCRFLSRTKYVRIVSASALFLIPLMDLIVGAETVTVSRRDRQLTGVKPGQSDSMTVSQCVLTPFRIVYSVSVLFPRRTHARAREGWEVMWWPFAVSETSR